MGLVDGHALGCLLHVSAAADCPGIPALQHPWPQTLSPSAGGSVQFQPELLWPVYASGLWVSDAFSQLAPRPAAAVGCPVTVAMAYSAIFSR